MKLYRTRAGCILEHEQKFFSLLGFSWDQLIANDDLEDFLLQEVAGLPQTSSAPIQNADLLPPIVSQEVWAAGVTYFRSRAARMEEAKSAGGGDFYDRVYNAERPELFFKATPSRVVGHHGKVAIRKDATWSVPEPELTLVVNPSGKIIGYTIGNDMSSRDIEGENPLYLPQAKVYYRSCSLEPGVLVSSGKLPSTTEIKLDILRDGTATFTGTTTISNLKRDPETLVSYLYRENVFPNGCFLLTGTGIVPPDSFTLKHGDEIRISIEGIGTLINYVG